MNQKDQWRLLSPSDLLEEVVEMFAKENAGKPDDGLRHISDFIPEALEQMAREATTTCVRAKEQAC